MIMHNYHRRFSESVSVNSLIFALGIVILPSMLEVKHDSVPDVDNFLNPSERFSPAGVKIQFLDSGKVEL